MKFFFWDRYNFLLVVFFAILFGGVFLFSHSAYAGSYCITKNGNKECRPSLIDWNVGEKFKNASYNYAYPSGGGSSKSMVWYNADHREAGKSGICNSRTCITEFQPSIDNLSISGPINEGSGRGPRNGIYYLVKFTANGNLKKIAKSDAYAGVSDSLFPYSRVILASDNNFNTAKFPSSEYDRCWMGYSLSGSEKSLAKEEQVNDHQWNYTFYIFAVPLSRKTTHQYGINCGILIESQTGLKVQKNVWLPKLPDTAYYEDPDADFGIDDLQTTTKTSDAGQGVKLVWSAKTIIDSLTIDGLNIGGTNIISGFFYVSPTTTTTYTLRVRNIRGERTRQVTVNVRQLSLSCTDVSLTPSGKDQITVSWRPVAADRVSVECATTLFRSCPKTYYKPGESAVLSNVDQGDTVVTVIAYQGNNSTPACSPKMSVSKEVNIIDVVVNGVNAGNVLLNSSLYELIAGQPCPNIPLVSSVCSAMSFNNIWRMAGSILTKLIPGLGDLVGVFVNFMKGPLVSILGVIAELVDNFVIHHNTIQNIGTSINQFIGGFVKNFIPNFIAGAANGVFNELMGQCIGSKMGGWVNVGVQAVYNLLGQTLNLLGNIPGLGGIGDIGKAITDPCPAGNSGCTIGTTVGQDEGAKIGVETLKDVVGTLIPGSGAFMDSALKTAHDFVEPIAVTIFPECKQEKKETPPPKQYIACDPNVGRCLPSPSPTNYTKDQQAACDDACKPMTQYYTCDTSIRQCVASTTPTLYTDKASCDTPCQASIKSSPIPKTGAGCGCPIHPELITSEKAGDNPVNVKRAVANAIMTSYYVVTSKGVPGGLCVTRNAAFACASSLYTNAQPIFSSIFKIAQQNKGDLSQHINTIPLATFQSIYNGAGTCAIALLSTYPCGPEKTTAQCAAQTSESDCQ